MSRVEVLIVALESGDLPPVCVKTGERTRDTLHRSFTVVPAWTSIIIVLSFLAWLVVRANTALRVRAVLPMSERAYRRLRATEWSARVAIVCAVASLVAAGGFGSDALAWAGIALLVAGFVASVVPGVGVVEGSAPDRVVLTRVSAEFARACGRREARRRSAGDE
jgi:hypothetical protein